MTDVPKWQLITLPFSPFPSNDTMDSRTPQESLSLPPTADLDEAEVDAQAAAIDVPDDTGEGGKLRMIIQLVKRSFGVKDLAAM
jgi:hypothetical protein